MFKIEIKHYAENKTESITIGEPYAAWKIYKALMMAAVDTERDLQQLTLYNQHGETLVQCSF